MTTAELENDAIRIDFVQADAGISYAIELRDGDGWHAIHDTPFPLRFLALHAADAAPVKVWPAWEAGKPETNFAAFHTDRSDGGYDAFTAGERLDLVPTVIEDGVGRVTCRTADKRFEAAFSLATDGVAVEWSFSPPSAGSWSVGFPAFAGLPEDEVSAILAGPFLTERRFPAVAGILPEGYIQSPFVLVECGPVADPLTWALCADPGVDDWNWRPVGESRYGLGARNEAGKIQPILFAPVLGNAGSWREAGEALRFRALLRPVAGSWWDAWRAIATGTYGLRSYRENMYGSLTDAVHNMVALMKDDVFGGWIERGRGFLNIEHRDGVKLASPAAVLSAGLVTGDRDLLASRALPILEYSLSRGHYGFTWSIGSTTVGQEHVRQAFEEMGGPAWDAPVLVALHQLARGATPALAELAQAQADGIDDFYIRRSNFQVSLSLYHLTGDAAWLDRAREQADAYIRERIDTPATDPVEGQRFLIHIGPDWMSLLDLWEATAEQRYLDAAERGARWLAALLWVQPLPGPEAAGEPRLTASTETVVALTSRFDRVHREELSGHSSWSRYDVAYPRGVDEVPVEPVPAWLTSPVGMSFEAWCTYWGRMVMNPGWAPYLLRLAVATGDDTYRLLADNAITGRFSNYPGYYYYVPSAAALKPDFPYLGPMDLTSIYYHHIPPQVGIALDYLIEQARDRSGGRIAFPVVRDDSYVQFRHHLPGHAAGRFFDIDDAWPWLPKGLVTLDTHLVNWLAAVSTDGTRVGIAFANSSGSEVTATVSLDRGLLGIPDRQSIELSVLRPGESEHDGGLPGVSRTDDPLVDPGAWTRPATLRESGGTAHGREDLTGDITVTIPPRGLVVIRIDGTRVDEPMHALAAMPIPAGNAVVTLAEDDPHLGTVRAMAVGTHPGQANAYAYTTLGPDRATALTLAWRDGDDWREETCHRFPFEVSVPMAMSPFRFRVTVTDHDGNRHEAAETVLEMPGAIMEGAPS